MDRGEAKTWILTGSPDNFRATREHGFRLIGMKERRRRMAETVAVGDRIVFYLTVVQAFAGIVRVTGEMYEDRTKVWPGKPGMPDQYPWRFATEPVLVLDEGAFVPAEDIAQQLEHVRKWPVEHWHLAFQGQLRTVSAADAAVVEDAIREAAAATADRVRTLLLRGDNLLKKGDDGARVARALAAFEEARSVAAGGSVDARVRDLVERRLESVRALAAEGVGAGS